MKKFVIRRQPAALVAGAVGSLALALSMNGSLSAFTASITNDKNSAATGSLAMRETLLDATGNATTTLCNSNDGTATSVATNSNTSCSSINKYGAAAVAPTGSSNVTKISITNTGTVPASAFTLTAAACSQSAQTITVTPSPSATPTASVLPTGGATDVCSHIYVSITASVGSAGGAQTTLTTTNESAAALASGGAIDLKSKLGLTNGLAAGQSVYFTFTVTMDTSVNNSYQGYVITQPITWNFTA